MGAGTGRGVQPPGGKWKPGEGISGNRIELVTAVKLQPQKLEQTLWLKKKRKDTD